MDQLRTDRHRHVTRPEVHESMVGDPHVLHVTFRKEEPRVWYLSSPKPET